MRVHERLAGLLRLTWLWCNALLEVTHLASLLQLVIVRLESVLAMVQRCTLHAALPEDNVVAQAQQWRGLHARQAYSASTSSAHADSCQLVGVYVTYPCISTCV